MLFALALVGCCPARQLATSTADSVVVEVRERIVEVRDTVVVELPAERVEVITPDTLSVVETSIARATAVVSGGLLHHSIENKAVALEQPLHTDVPVRDSIIYREKVVKDIVEVPADLSWWQETQIRGFQLLALAFLLLILIKKIR